MRALGEDAKKEPANLAEVCPHRIALCQQLLFFALTPSFSLFRSLPQISLLQTGSTRTRFPACFASQAAPSPCGCTTTCSTICCIRSRSSIPALPSPFMQFHSLQVCGRKRITMFAPCDRLKLYCDGDKSKVGDPAAADLSRFPLLQHCEPFVCDLADGEVLYIPAMWFHHVKMLTFGSVSHFSMLKLLLLTSV